MFAGPPRFCTAYQQLVHFLQTAKMASIRSLQAQAFATVGIVMFLALVFPSSAAYESEVTVQAGEEGVRFLLISGKPIAEPVAWYGPIVMNTQDELKQAVGELRNGTFIKHPR